MGASAGADNPVVPESAVSAETHEVRIGLPEGSSSPVSVSIGEGGVSIELPKGAAFPLDFVTASGGFLRSGEVAPMGGDRIRLNLMLARGLLSGIVFEPRSVVIEFQQRLAAMQPSAAEADESYRLGPGDRIQLTIAEHPELSRQLVVASGGSISVPLVGEVNAGGRSCQELSDHLSELLARDFLVDPQVDVEVAEYRSQWVMVVGEVRKPGRVALHRGVATLKDVLADAEGMTGNAGEEILISRTVAGGGGEPATLRIDRAAFELGESNPRVLSGDIVNVKSAAFVYITGEVRTPGKVTIERGMTLLKAIALAGGLTEWANRSEIQVLQEAPNSPVLRFNLKRIENRKIPDPPLHGGETIVVKRRLL